MKRLGICLMVVLMVGCLLTGCGDSKDIDTSGSFDMDQNVENEAGNADSVENYTGFILVYQGTEIPLNTEATPILEALGEADSYFESESCAFQGLDKVYTYGSIVINTYPEEEVDYIYNIELKDDTIETEEGIYIGSTIEDVIAAYGEPVKETDTAYIYEKGESQLSFIFNGDVVESILYTAITE